MCTPSVDSLTHSLLSYNIPQPTQPPTKTTTSSPSYLTIPTHIQVPTSPFPLQLSHHPTPKLSHPPLPNPPHPHPSPTNLLINRLFQHPSAPAPQKPKTPISQPDRILTPTPKHPLLTHHAPDMAHRSAQLTHWPHPSITDTSCKEVAFVGTGRRRVCAGLHTAPSHHRPLAETSRRN